MTTMMLLIGFVLVMTAGGVALRRLLRQGSPTAASPGECELLASNGSRAETYRPMSRLFAEEDFAFLAAHAPSRRELEKRLRHQRSQVLRLYLCELRLEFQGVYAICRLLAAQSQDPNFASLITRQVAAFYGLWLILQVRCSLGWYLHVRVDTADLVNAFDSLRQAARACVLASTAQPAMVSSAV